MEDVDYSVRLQRAVEDVRDPDLRLALEELSIIVGSELGRLTRAAQARETDHLFARREEVSTIVEAGHTRGLEKEQVLLIVDALKIMQRFPSKRECDPAYLLWDDALRSVPEAGNGVAGIQNKIRNHPEYGFADFRSWREPG